MASRMICRATLFYRLWVSDMPRNFKSILFWFDGAFGDSTASITLRTLRPEISGAEKATLRQKLQALHQELAIGKIDAAAYCRKAVELAQVNEDTSRLASRIVEDITLNKSFFDIYCQIAAEHDPRVIVDIPRAWFTEVINHWGAAENFPASRLIFTETLKLERMLPDIAYHLPRAAGRNMADCILVDPLQMRAVALHKLGLISTAFVYPRRLKIDLALQGIWKTTEDVYHPQAGTRANL